MSLRERPLNGKRIECERMGMDKSPCEPFGLDVVHVGINKAVSIFFLSMLMHCAALVFFARPPSLTRKWKGWLGLC